MIGISSLVFGYMIYVLERNIQPVFTFQISLYLAFETQITGYATDSFGAINPKRWPTRFVCITSTFVGIFAFALLLELIHTWMLPSKIEEKAVELIAEEKLRKEAQAAAAVTIQRWWRLWSSDEDDPQEWHVLERRLQMSQKELRRAMRSLRSFQHQHGHEFEIQLPSNEDREKAALKLKLDVLNEKLDALLMQGPIVRSSVHDLNIN